MSKQSGIVNQACKIALNARDRSFWPAGMWHA